MRLPEGFPKKVDAFGGDTLDVLVAGSLAKFRRMSGRLFPPAWVGIGRAQGRDDGCRDLLKRPAALPRGAGCLAWRLPRLLPLCGFAGLGPGCWRASRLGRLLGASSF